MREWVPLVRVMAKIIIRRINLILIDHNHIWSRVCLHNLCNRAQKENGATCDPQGHISLLPILSRITAHPIMESAPQFIWAGPMYVLSKPDDNPYDSPKEVATKSKGRVRLRLRNGCVLDFESHGRLIFGSTKSRVNCKNRWCCLITPIIHEETTIEAITGGHRGWAILRLCSSFF